MKIHWTEEELLESSRVTPELVLEAERIVAQCSEVLMGRNPVAQGAALAELVAMWIAGHRDEEIRLKLVGLHGASVLRYLAVHRESPQDTPDGSGNGQKH